MIGVLIIGFISNRIRTTYAFGIKFIKLFKELLS